MSKARWTSDAFRKQGLIETPNGFVKSKTLVAEKVVKIKLPPDYMHISKVGILKTDGTVEPVIKPNAKIRNATKSVENGISFDSNLEKYLYQSLTSAKIDFEFQVEYLLQEKFRYGTEAIRAITLTVDFVLRSRNIICDSKGLQTQQGAMRWKMLKRVILKECERTGWGLPKIVILKNRKECDAFVNRLLYGK